MDSVSGIQIKGGAAVFKEPIKGSLIVELYLDDRKLFKERTTLDNNLTVRWELNPPIILKDGSRLAIKLSERKSYVTKKSRAEASVSFDECQRLILSCPGELKELKQNDNSMATISILADCPDTLQPPFDSAVATLEQTKAILDHLGRAKQFLQTIMQLGTIASELNPIAKLVFGYVNLVYQKLQNQEQCNQLILDLAKDMASTLGYIEDVKQFTRLGQLKQAIKDVKPLMEDTTNFIVELTGNQQALHSLLSPRKQEQIDELTKRFNRFKQQFDRGVSVQTAANLEMLLKDLESTKDDKWLDKLEPQGHVRGHPTAELMDGTRKDIMAEIDEWCDDFDTARNILWIRGFPGVGKSAIARKLATRLKSSHRFGASLFFQRELAAAQTPVNLWRTFAFDLSCEYPSVRHAIVTKLKDGEVDLDNTDAGELFQGLVEEPLKHSTDIPLGRLPVVVIDALDECGGLDGSRSKNRTILLQNIKAWTRLAPQFKLVVTSRPEDDISRALSAISHHIELGSGDNVSPSSSNDIHAFLSREFAQIAESYPESLLPSWPGLEAINDFTKRSAGLFIYADTLIKFVKEGQPDEQLERIFLAPFHHGSLTQLYNQILNVSFKDPTTKVLDGFRDVTGTIILAKIPLRRQDIVHLLGMKPVALDHICQGLRSVLDSGDLLRFTHQSFVDFLMDYGGCPSLFLFHNTIQSRTLLLASLRVMKNELRFNICKLESSHVLHDDIPDLQMRVHDNIPMHLEYACRFWTNHIQKCDFDVHIAEEVEHFMTGQFLYWLEVMSLLRKMNQVTQGLRSVIAWSKGRDLREITDQADLGQRVVVFVTDGAKFVAAFATLMVQSVPHIYLSAIPFAPSESIVAETFRQKYMNILSVNSAKARNWPAIQKILYGHAHVVSSVAFSPDGSRIASTSRDKTIRVWDAETGDIIFKPVEGHSDDVTSVAFSPDGSRIVSGSHDRTIRFWDGETGDPVSNPLKGHSRAVTSIALSHDGCRIASGSVDNTIRLWDAGTGDVISDPLEGHSGVVSSIAFSPDGSRIASGSWDKTIRLWDSKTGDAVSSPLEGHSGGITSVAFSPDGSHIASASGDYTIRLWDAETGNAISKPFEGHSDHVSSVAFSPDGSRIVSGSRDNTIRLWDAKTGNATSKPLDGHYRVNSVAFSPDGSRIVSCADDKTIRLWDAETSDAISNAFEGHFNVVTSAAFSPVGSCLVSGSWDNTVRLWDVETGDPVSNPLAGHSRAVTSVALSPDGSRIMSGSSDNTIRLWDSKTGDAISNPLEGHSASITSVAFSPDGSRVVSSSYDNTIRFWDAKTGNAIINPLGGHSQHTATVTSVAFSPDGSRLVSGSHDKTIRFWDAETGEAISNPLEGHSGPITSVAFSPDGSRVVSGSFDNTIRFWDAESGNAISNPLKGHSSVVTSVAFSPDGSRIVSGSWDHTICLWDAKNAAIIKVLKGHSDHINSVAFSPDGSHIVSSSSDKTIRLWDAQVPDMTNTMGCTDDSELLPSGWVVNSAAEKLFWVPPWYRVSLCLYGNKMTISRDGVTTPLDMSRFVHGTAWEQCKTGWMILA